MHTEPTNPIAYRVTSYGAYGTVTMTLDERPSDTVAMLGNRYSIEIIEGGE